MKIAIFREKKWVQLIDTTMKVYKWIPVTTMPQDQNKKHLKQLDSNQNSMSDKENSKLTNDLAEDSNTCKFDRALMQLESTVTNQFFNCSFQALASQTQNRVSSKTAATNSSSRRTQTRRAATYRLRNSRAATAELIDI